MLNPGAGRGAPELDVDGAGAAGVGVQAPDLKVAIENDHAAVVRDVRPQHPTVSEMGNRLGFATLFLFPNVFRAIAIGNVIKAATVFAPHRPPLFGAALADLLII